MRDILTGLAIILIVVLTTALVAPYFVDWNNQRGFLETQLSRTLGQKVTIGGNIDLKLLPTPYLVLDQTVIGSDDGPVRIGIHHLDLELSVTPLFHGEFDVVEALLEEPTIRVTLQADRTLPRLPAAPAFRADIRFDRIAIADGRLAVADPQSGRTFVFDHLDLTAEAPSLAGPYKVSGSEGSGAARTKFRFATTTAHVGRMRAHLAIEENLAHPGIDLDGDLTLATTDPDAIRQSFDGTTTITDHLWSEDETPVAWRLSGSLKADPAGAKLDSGELRIGNDDAGVTLKASADGRFSEAPSLAVALSAAQLDLDRLSGAPIDPTKPPAPPKLPDFATLRRMLASATPPIPTQVDLSIDNATYGGDALSNLQAHIETGGNGRRALKLAGEGPRGSRIELNGTLLKGGDSGFDGAVTVGAANLPHALDWLASVDPDVTLKPADLPFESLTLSAMIAARTRKIEARDVKLDLDGSTLTGTGTWTDGTGDRHAKIAADLKAKVLDLGSLPSVAAIRGMGAPFDLDLQLAADTIRVSRVGDGALETGKLSLDFVKDVSGATLKGLHVVDFGGASVGASGTLDRDGAALKLDLDAAKLDQAAALFKQLAPGDLADVIVARAGTLAPAKIDIDARFVNTPKDDLKPSRVALNGRLGATTIDASLGPDEAQSDAISVKATTQTSDGRVLLRQLGITEVPAGPIGPTRINLSAHGTPDQPLDTRVQAALGPTRLEVSGRFRLSGDAGATGRIDGAGDATLRSADIAPLLRAFGVASPDTAAKIAVDVASGMALGPVSLNLGNLKGRLANVGFSGDLGWKIDAGAAPRLTGSLAIDRLAMADLVGLAFGAPQPVAANAQWSERPFEPPLLALPRSAVSVKGKVLDLTDKLRAEDVSFDLGTDPDVVTLKNLGGRVSGGRFSANLTLRRDGRQATLEGSAAVDRVHVDIPSLNAVMTGKLDLAGSGSSALALVANLAGSGDATVTQATVPGAGPQALQKVFDDVEDDAVAVDDESIVRALDTTKTGALDLGMRHFGLSLATGTLNVAAKDADTSADDGVTSTLSASLDLRRLTYDEHITQTLHALPKNWTGEHPAIVVTLSGPFDAPRRLFDVGGFVNAAAARAIARESARIEAYEFDVRERALFNARLQSERLRERDRRQAEADAAAEAARRAALEAAKRAEAERRARAEAARLEHQRQDAAAKPPEPNSPPEPPTGAQPEGRAQDGRPRFEAPRAGTTTDPSASGRY